MHLISFRYHKEIITKLTNKLQVKPDLMHPPSVRTAEHNTGRSIEAQTLKLSPALFSSSDQNCYLWKSDVFFTHQPFTKKRKCCLTGHHVMHICLEGDNTWRPYTPQSCN